MRIAGELFDEAMQTRAVVGTHMHELDAHTVAGACVADDGACTNFTLGTSKITSTWVPAERGSATRRNAPPTPNSSAFETLRFPAPCQPISKSLGAV